MFEAPQEAMPSRATMKAMEESQLAATDVGERRRGAGDQREAELGRVKGDRGFDIVDHVADVHRHG